MAAVEQPFLIGNTQEIIDVDLLNDDDIRSLQPPRQRRRISSPSSIFIFDGDEGARAADGAAHDWSTPRRRPQRRLAQSRRLFSPPPPPQDDTIPPVPPLPHSSRMPLRRLPFSRGMVRPNSQPFEFEANITPPANHHDSQPAPRSHHQPVMGFGGAMINFISTAFQRITGIPPQPPPPPQPETPRHGSNEMLAFLAEAGRLDFGGGRVMRERRRDQIVYKPTYTHPWKPAPGFIFDFAPDDDNAMDTSLSPQKSSSSNKSSVETTLVCARCLDPLVLGGAGAGAGIEGRMWGLRCGHLLDGKCVAEIMKPPLLASETEKTDRRGKGKGKALTQDMQDNPMRSRLRPRPIINPPFSMPVSPLTPLKRKPSVSVDLKDRYEWACPVVRCAKSHASVLYHGSEDWVMDPSEGAVGIFV